MIFRKKALEKIKQIHRLSLLVNKQNHRKKLLHLANKHIIEIEQLYSKKDPHADIETGDLAVLCFELILESNRNLDEVLEKCFSRYEKKLNMLAEQSKVQ
ncbi:MAG TPA: hypothetical protein PLW07_05795 [bacterium]|nr:hypothetical protein [bacterium]